MLGALNSEAGTCSLEPLKEGASLGLPERAISLFKSGHPPPGHRTPDPAPFQRRAEPREGPGGRPGPLPYVPEPLEAHFSFANSGSAPSPGRDRGSLQNPECGTEVTSVSLRINPWFRWPPIPRHT